MEVDMLHRPPLETGFFDFGSRNGSDRLTSDQRIQRLRDWCKVDESGFIPEGTSNRMDLEYAQRFLRLRQGNVLGSLFGAVEKERNWNYMVNILGMSTIEITVARYFKYKDLVNDAKRERLQIMKLNGFTEKSKPNSSGASDPKFAKFSEVENRMLALTHVHKACMRKLISLHLMFVNKKVADASYVAEHGVAFKTWLEDRKADNRVVELYDSELFNTVLVASRQTGADLVSPFAEHLQKASQPAEEPPILMFSIVTQLREIEKELTTILTDYEGNYRLKDCIYADLMKYLTDGRRAIEVYRNYVFMGPSGVGKTTWARLMGNIYKAAGVYIFGEVRETDGTDFAGAFLNHGGPQTKNVLNLNLENIVIIDEAYSLTETKSMSGVPIGAESVTAIVNYMDKFRGCILIIIAGYEDKMSSNSNSFLAVNEGLSRRFPYKVVFKSYTAAQMVEMLAKRLQRSGITAWNKDAFDHLRLMIENCMLAKKRLDYHTTNPGLGSLRDKDVKTYETVSRMYDTLFSKQGGSMENIAAVVETYTSLPSMIPSPGSEYMYDPDMMNVLATILPTDMQDTLSNPKSDVLKVLRQLNINKLDIVMPETWKGPEL